MQRLLGYRYYPTPTTVYFPAQRDASPRAKALPYSAPGQAALGLAESCGDCRPFGTATAQTRWSFGAKRKLGAQKRHPKLRVAPIFRTNSAPRHSPWPAPRPTRGRAPGGSGGWQGQAPAGGSDDGRATGRQQAAQAAGAAGDGTGGGRAAGDGTGDGRGRAAQGGGGDDRAGGGRACSPPMTRDQIDSSLWPDLSGRQLGNALHTALRELRWALGDGGGVAPRPAGPPGPRDERSNLRIL
jgi:hypothetical protein